MRKTIKTRIVKGFKVFNSDWTCRGKQYTCPGVFKEDVTPTVFGQGMHFCRRAVDCFDYYSFNPENKVAEVIAYGDIEEEGDKCCTNNLKIVREIPWDELIGIVNTGYCCSGIGNSGDMNSGDRNSGDMNSGNWNSGNWNGGNWNGGFFNSCIGSSGVFCNVDDDNIRIFNIHSGMSMHDFCESKYFDAMFSSKFELTKWIDYTYDEKEKDPKKELIGGYLKTYTYKEACANWWEGMSDENREIIKSIPNFNADVFEKITGIKI